MNQGRKMKFVWIGEYPFFEDDFKEIFESFINKILVPESYDNWKIYINPILYMGGNLDYTKKAKGNIEIEGKKLIFKSKSFFHKMKLEVPLESISTIEIKKGKELERSNSTILKNTPNPVQEQMKYLSICYHKSLNKENCLFFELTKKAENELANLANYVKSLQKKEENSKTPFEAISKQNLKNLEFSLIEYLGGFRAHSSGVTDAYFGIFDPVYGMYRNTLKTREEQRYNAQSDRMSSSLTIIERFYHKYPRLYRAYLEDVAMRLKEEVNGNIHQRNVILKKKTVGLINTISRKCSNCSEKIPKGVKTCPYCDAKVSMVSEEREVEEPLHVLKLRLAKGEISIEQYNSLKKLLKS